MIAKEEMIDSENRHTHPSHVLTDCVNRMTNTFKFQKESLSNRRLMMQTAFIARVSYLFLSIEVNTLLVKYLPNLEVQIKYANTLT